MADNIASSKTIGIEPTDLHPDGRRLTRREIREREKQERIWSAEPVESVYSQDMATNVTPLAETIPNQLPSDKQNDICKRENTAADRAPTSKQIENWESHAQDVSTASELDTTESATAVSIEPAWTEDIILQPADEPSGKIPRLPQRAPVAELFARSGGNVIADKEEINLGKLVQKLNMDPAALAMQSAATDFISNDALSEDVSDKQPLSAQTAPTLSADANNSAKLLLWWHYLLIYSVIFVLGLVLGIIFFGGK